MVRTSQPFHYELATNTAMNAKERNAVSNVAGAFVNQVYGKNGAQGKSSIRFEILERENSYLFSLCLVHLNVTILQGGKRSTKGNAHFRECLLMSGVTELNQSIRILIENNTYFEYIGCVSLPSNWHLTGSI